MQQTGLRRWGVRVRERGGEGSSTVQKEQGREVDVADRYSDMRLLGQQTATGMLLGDTALTWTPSSPGSDPSARTTERSQQE